MTEQAVRSSGRLRHVAELGMGTFAGGPSKGRPPGLFEKLPAGEPS